MEPEAGKEVMTSNCESSSAILKLGDEKPVVVRVKRKVNQSPLDAFWLEINERPAKRALLEFDKLSISGSSAKGSSIVVEPKSKRVLVQHVQTVLSSEATVDLVQTVVSNSADAIEDKTPAVERRHTFKKDNRQNQLSKSIQKREELAKTARFEQIWRSRKGKKEEVDEMYNFYEVVRVDNVEEKSIDTREQEDMSLEDHRYLTSFMPLLREFIPSAAKEIESDFQAHMSSQDHADADEYVYDYYTVNDDMDVEKENTDCLFPLVLVDDEDFYDVQYESEHDSEDSNAEDNPNNDYPNEISSEDEDDDEDEDESESETASGSEEEDGDESESNSSKPEGYSCGSKSSSEIEGYDGNEADDIDFSGGSDSNDDGEDWRWNYR